MDLLLPPELNDPRFLTDLFVEGLDIRDNSAAVTDAPGLGIRVNEEAIRRHTPHGEAFDVRSATVAGSGRPVCIEPNSRRSML